MTCSILQNLEECEHASVCACVPLKPGPGLPGNQTCGEPDVGMK